MGVDGKTRVAVFFRDISMEAAPRLNAKQLAEYEERRIDLEGQHTEYLQSHPELRDLLNDFMTSVLLHQPKDIFLFARDYFGVFNPEPDYYKPLVLAGPSGVGKGTLIKLLTDRYPSMFDFSVSCTTRKPRPGEVHGQHYYFVTMDEYNAKKEQGEFVEYNEVHGNYYGTLRSEIERIKAEGKVVLTQICILDIDVGGAKKIFDSGLDSNYLFIMPPSMKELENRLRGRGTEDENALRTRLRNARAEIDEAKELTHMFKKMLTNDDVEEAFRGLLRILATFYQQIDAEEDS